MEAVTVLARYTDGTAVKGFTYDFSPSKDRFHVYSSTTLAGKPVEVFIKDLKAVLFVRDFEGSSQLREGKSSLGVERHVGRKMEVTFQDGEVVAGLTLGYERGRTGFFLFPADARTNTLRVFVISRALRAIRYLGEVERGGRPQAQALPGTTGFPGTYSGAAPRLNIPPGQPTGLAALPRRYGERRRAPRVRPNQPLHVRMFGYARLPVLNISATGLLFEHTEPIRPGVCCQLELERSGEKVRLCGRVVRSSVTALRGGHGAIQYCTAVQFLENPQGMRGFLPEFSAMHESGSPSRSR